MQNPFIPNLVNFFIPDADPVVTDISPKEVTDDLITKAKKKTKAIVYNPASVDSVVASAILAHGKGIRVAVPCNEKALSLRVDEIHWVGVKPSKRTTGVLSKAEHIGYHYDDSDKSDALKASFSHIEKYEDDSLNFPITLTQVVVDVLSRGHDYDQNYWNLSRVVAGLLYCTNTLNSEELAMLYKNYRHAQECLMENYAYVYQPFHSGDLIQYNGFLKTLKASIGNAWSSVRIVKDSHVVTIPVVNLPSDQTSWAIRLISGSYDNIAVYENISDKSVFTLFSRSGDLRSVIMRNTQRHNDVVFSGEL